MKYNPGDVIDTNLGMLIVQAPIEFKPNTHPNCDKLGGRTLYWLQNLEHQDVLLWDTELEKELTEVELMSQNLNEEDLFLY